MALEYTLQSIPHNCGLVDAARTNPEIGEFLELFGFADVSFEDLKFRAGDEVFARFVAEVKVIREANGGIEDRRLNIGNRWDALLYLLLEERRDGGRVGEYTWQSRAICGGDIIGTSISSTRGVPIRLLSAFETKKVAGEFSSLDKEEINEQFDLRKMVDAGVYGSGNGTAVLSIDVLKRDIERLTDFYISAAANDEGVLTFCA